MTLKLSQTVPVGIREGIEWLDRQTRAGKYYAEYYIWTLKITNHTSSNEIQKSRTMNYNNYYFSCSNQRNENKNTYYLVISVCPCSFLWDTISFVCCYKMHNHTKELVVCNKSNLVVMYASWPVPASKHSYPIPYLL